MSESTLPTPTATIGTPEPGAKSLSSLVLHLSEGFDASTNLADLLRAAGRHLRKLVDCQKSRIWLARRAGWRLVARDFPGGDGAPTLLRLARDEGLPGWVFGRGETLRLGPGDPRPELPGGVPEFQSCLVVPLYRRGEVFAAIECLDKQGGGPFTAEDAERLEVAGEHGVARRGIR